MMGEQIWREYLQASSQRGSRKGSEREADSWKPAGTVRTGDVSRCPTLRDGGASVSVGLRWSRRVDSGQFINEGGSIPRLS